MTHWRASCWINCALGGRADEPLCSRVYRQPESRWRTAYLRLMDLAFDEPDHCLRVHVIYLIR